MNYNEYIEFELLKINGRFYALKDKEADCQLQMNSDYSYIGEEYNVEYLGGIRIPIEYFEQYAEKSKQDQVPLPE